MGDVGTPNLRPGEMTWDFQLASEVGIVGAMLWDWAINRWGLC